MKTHWTLHTNAKSEKNARVLLNQVARLLQQTPASVEIDGDRYCGHAVEFELEGDPRSRAEAFYTLLLQAERLGNSWTLGAIAEPAMGWTTRSRIAGVQRLEWREL